MFGFDDLGTQLFKLANTVIERVVKDPTAAAAAKLEVLKLQQTGELAQLAAETDLAKGQLEINKAEAANPSTFVSGARPFILWVCGSAFAWNYVVMPFFGFVMTAAGHPVAVSPLDMTTMMPVLGGLLGLGGYRMVEKIRGVASK